MYTGFFFCLNDKSTNDFYFYRAHNADLRVLVVDSTDFDYEERSLKGFIQNHLMELGLGKSDTEKDWESNCEELMKDLIVVFNKNDLCDVTAHEDYERSLDHDLSVPLCHLSCVTESGIDEFLEQVKSSVAGLCADPSSGTPSLTQARHRYHLQECLKALEAYSDYSEGDIVLAAQELRIALRQVGKITGKISSEEILDVIFKDFCIGK